VFRKPPDAPGERLTVVVDGAPVVVTAGDSAASAALLAGLTATRSTPISGLPRAPYCMMGVCFDCLMTIDGVPSRQACLEPVRDGMRIERQDGRPELGSRKPRDTGCIA
jgi:D-hydroxyproline dehydrogenase subunit gamma